MKVVVTGADGFIGSHLVETLVKEGYEVTAFCQYNSWGSYGWLDNINKEIKKSIEFILGDIRDTNSVYEALKGKDIVYHLAALIAIPYSYTAAESYVQTNVIGTLNVLQAANKIDSLRVIHTSTSETYGTAQFVPITEKHPISAQSPYAASKVGADQLALSFWRSHKTPVTVLRPFNTYGPRQSNRAVIPTIITQIATGQNKIELGKTTPTRDFNYVQDTCNAFTAVGKYDNTIGEVINCASNFEISIEETARVIAEVMNKNIEIVSVEERMRPKDSEVERLFGDNTLLKTKTDWEPKYGGLEGFKKGIEATASWFKDKNNMKHYKNSSYTV